MKYLDTDLSLEINLKHKQLQHVDEETDLTMSSYISTVFRELKASRVSGSTMGWVWYKRTNFQMTYEVKCKLLDGNCNRLNLILSSVLLEKCFKKFK